MDQAKLSKLREVISESTRVQTGGAKPVTYIDVSNALGDIGTKQNHVIFARRGCGKSLLLHTSSEKLPTSTIVVPINCEDFKHHSFPNVLIEILDSLLLELENRVKGWLFFGPKHRARKQLNSLRKELEGLRVRADERVAEINHKTSNEDKSSSSFGGGVKHGPASADAKAELSSLARTEVEAKYSETLKKIVDLDKWLIKLKRSLTECFKGMHNVDAVYLHIDDLYHLMREDQPLVMDYVHRLCKNMPLFFKIATLRHVSTLYAERNGQPIGAQERNDYLPIDVDFTLENFRQTVEQNKRIFAEFGRRADLQPTELDSLFKGVGFERLILAGGGVPRDCLSLFLSGLDAVQPPNGDGRIGKDDVRLLSRPNFERRIADLKIDSTKSEQSTLIKGIYVLRKMFLDRKTNILMVPEELLQRDDALKGLIYRLLDYRIVHSAGSALTHKSQPGTYHAFAIDIGCYANMRKLDQRFTEIDLSQSDAKERMRSAPVFDDSLFYALWNDAPAEINEAALTADEPTPI